MFLQKLRAFWRSPRLRQGGLATALVCLVASAVLAVNLLITQMETRYSWRRDYSFNALTTQSEQTLDILTALNKPVHIYALFSRGDEDLPLMELLGRYAAASPLVTWEQVDISLNPSLLTRFRASTEEEAITNDSLIVSCEETGRFKVLSPSRFVSWSYNEADGTYQPAGYTYESAITSAISYVSQDRIPRAMILSGHGELDEDATAVLAALLDSNNYDVAYFTLNSAEAALSPDDLLLVLSPRRDLTGDELQQVSTFIDGGGSIFFTCDLTDPIQEMPNWLALMRSYGFLPLEGVAVAAAAEKNTYYNGVRTCLIPIMQSTVITQSLVEGHNDTLLLAGSRAFELPQEADRSLNTVAVLTTTDAAYLRSLTDGKNTLEKQSTDLSGPFALALEAERVTASGEVSRAFVLGCSTLLTSEDIYAMTDTQDFLVRVMAYLLDTSPADLGIVAKAAIRPQLTAARLTGGVAAAVALPVCVVAVAAIVLGLRRRRSGHATEEHSA